MKGNAHGEDLASRLILAFIIECSYVIVTRIWLKAMFSGVELELWTSVFRLLCILAYWKMFRRLILSHQPDHRASSHPLLWVALLILMSAPVLAGRYNLPDVGTKAVFFGTSWVVAIREEIFYRGVLQNLMQRRFSPWLAILASNFLFTLYHYGAQSFTLVNLVGLMACGCVFGLLYLRTGSILLVIMVHAVYDAIWTLSPYLAQPFPHALGMAIELCVLALCLFWSCRIGTKADRGERAG